MPYRFHSPASADVLMLNAQGDALLEALGRPKRQPGSLMPEQLGAALERLQQAVQRSQAAQAQAQAQALEHAAAHPECHDELSRATEPEPEPEPQFSQRAWPLQQMLERALAEQVHVRWEL